uniref:Uncharacterized protein n=1 Tax=Arundo donax TaxID=35708 RepID=A0A0A9BDX3_ARUDO
MATEDSQLTCFVSGNAAKKVLKDFPMSTMSDEEATS